MPILNGIDAARQIKGAWPGAKLLFLSMHANAVYLREALNAGGSGYVLKSSATEELRAAIRRVLKGEIYVARAFGRDVLESLRTPSGRRPRSSIELTDRQREVLQLIAEGRGNIVGRSKILVADGIGEAFIGKPSGRYRVCLECSANSQGEKDALIDAGWINGSLPTEVVQPELEPEAAKEAAAVDAQLAELRKSKKSKTAAEAWGTYTKVSDAISYGEIFNGHHFWVISFPTANALPNNTQGGGGNWFASLYLLMASPPGGAGNV
jgi:hypothetical protein